MKCDVCGKEFPYKNPKQFSSAMRRHRKSAHADLRGSIRYSRVEDKPTLH